MKKFILYPLIAVIGIILIILIINQFDASELDPLFTEADLNKVTSYEADNAFYMILGFDNKPELDPLSKKSIETFKKIMTVDANWGEYGESLEELRGKWSYDYIKIPDDLSWTEYLKVNKEDLIKTLNTNAVLISRAEKLIKADKIEDFSIPSFQSYIPNSMILVNNLQTIEAKIFLDAIESNTTASWDNACNKILKIIDFSRKWQRNSRFITTWIMALRSNLDALKALNMIFDTGKCSPAIEKKILDALSQINADNSGFKNTLVTEYFRFLEILDLDDLFAKQYVELGFISRIFYNLTYQKNRTHKMIIDEMKIMYERSLVEPFKRKDYKFIAPADGSLWWLHNPGGKMIISTALPNFEQYTNFPYQLKLVNHLTLLHVLAVQANIKSAAMKNWLKQKAEEGFINPFSGEAYTWNVKENQVEAKIDKKYMYSSEDKIFKVPYKKYSK